jgi:sugar fermentation stimulation protein A
LTLERIHVALDLGTQTRWERGGTYLLILWLENEERIEVGKLGTFHFPSGYYVYSGSALAGLGGRLRRHCRQRRVLHWHIDYLLQRAKIEEIRAEVSPERLECKWAKAIGGLAGAESPSPGFGASDCSCRTHLAYFRHHPELEGFGSRFQASSSLEKC